MALAIDENPPELLAPLDDPMLLDRHWCVVRTRSRMEKKLAWFLCKLRVPYYLPYVRTRTVSRNTVLSPLFSGILFMSYAPGDGTLDAARGSFSVANYLFTKDQIRLRRELSFLAYGTDTRLEPESNFRDGDLVQVIDGPYKGLTGRVSLTAGVLRIFVQLTLIGVTVSKEIDPQIVRSV